MKGGSTLFLRLFTSVAVLIRWFVSEYIAQEYLNQFISFAQLHVVQVTTFCVQRYATLSGKFGIRFLLSLFTPALLKLLSMSTSDWAIWCKLFFFPMPANVWRNSETKFVAKMRLSPPTMDEHNFANMEHAAWRNYSVFPVSLFKVEVSNHFHCLVELKRSTETTSLFPKVPVRFCQPFLPIECKFQYLRWQIRSKLPFSADVEIDQWQYLQSVYLEQPILYLK